MLHRTVFEPPSNRHMRLPFCSGSGSILNATFRFLFCQNIGFAAVFGSNTGLVCHPAYDELVHDALRFFCRGRRGAIATVCSESEASTCLIYKGFVQRRRCLTQARVSSTRAVLQPAPGSRWRDSVTRSSILRERQGMHRAYI